MKMDIKCEIANVIKNVAWCYRHNHHHSAESIEMPVNLTKKLALPIHLPNRNGFLFDVDDIAITLDLNRYPLVYNCSTRYLWRWTEKRWWQHSRLQYQHFVCILKHKQYQLPYFQCVVFSICEMHVRATL